VDEESGDFEVIGSREELKERAVEGWAEFEGHTPHRPWIDLVKIRNPRTGNLMSRISDVGNPWLDAGIVPFSTMGYYKDKAEWEKWFPADLITECFPGQFRNWFYALLAMSTMLEAKAPFKTLLGHALVRDQTGDEMHKSKGNSIPFEGAADNGYEIKGKNGKMEKHPPMGADLVRWMFCRQNPSQNINFGPQIAEEVRARFLLKLWNTYAFLCNYARLDGFDPSGPQVPLERRTDLDRWILSDLQKLVRQAEHAFTHYDLAPFCLEVERFIDDKLSNWYVRRNRRRFWKAGAGEDKTAAYQTLHTAISVVCRLVAPLIPFVTDHMYRNLHEDGAESSVHLALWPYADESMEDAALSEEMEALLRLVSLGLSARNNSKIKVRQPLAEIVIAAGTEAEVRAAARFGDQIAEELNIKKVSVHPAGAGPLLTAEVRLNLKTCGQRLGARLKEAQTALAALDPTEVAGKLLAGGTVEIATSTGPEPLTAADVQITHKGREGFTGVADRATQVALDTRVTHELALEGMARDIIRQVQDLRKKSGLEMEDRIQLHLVSDNPKVTEAIEAHRAGIAAETLTTHWKPGGKHAASAQVDGAKLEIQLEKI
jgi:isoleucyl-tRNA synthetase